MNQHILFTMTFFYSLVLFLPLSMLLLYKWPRLWHYLLSIFLGILVGVNDAKTDEASLTVLLLLVFGFFLGFNQPKGAWRWGLLISIFTPLFAILSILMKGSMEKMVSDGIMAFLAIVPAMIGAHAGVWLRSLAKATTDDAKAQG